MLEAKPRPAAITPVPRIRLRMLVISRTPSLSRCPGGADAFEIPVEQSNHCGREFGLDRVLVLCLFSRNDEVSLISDPVNVSVEAETGTLSAGGTFDSNHAGFTGTGFANTANAAGAYVDIPVTVSAAGTKTLTFRYSDGTTAARPATISVNGTSHGTLNFPATANWDTWAKASISVPLTAGTNHIRVIATTAAGDGNIDSVTVS